MRKGYWVIQLILSVAVLITDQLARNGLDVFSLIFVGCSFLILIVFLVENSHYNKTKQKISQYSVAVSSFTQGYQNYPEITADNKNVVLIKLKKMYKFCLFPSLNEIMVIIYAVKNVFAIKRKRSDAFWAAIIPYAVILIIYEIIWFYWLRHFQFQNVAVVWQVVIFVIINYALSVIRSFIYVLIHKAIMKNNLNAEQYAQFKTAK